MRGAVSVEVHNVDGVLSGIRRARNMGRPPFITKALVEGGEVLRDEIKKNIAATPLVDTWELYDSVEVRVPDAFEVHVVVDKPYAHAHEYGYKQKEITPKQKGYFWHMYRETGDKMWKCMALKGSYTITRKGYVREAVDTKSVNTFIVIGKAWGQMVLSAFASGAKAIGGAIRGLFR